MPTQKSESSRISSCCKAVTAAAALGAEINLWGTKKDSSKFTDQLYDYHETLDYAGLLDYALKSKKNAREIFVKCELEKEKKGMKGKKGKKKEL
jgi:hypothetical protein